MIQTTSKVAVVDDDPSYLRALERLLRAAGFAVLGYRSAESFLEESPRPPLDCAVLDIRLGTMTGFDLARRLAAEGLRVPVIFMTGHDSPEARAEAIECGCAAYLRKPFSAQSVFEAIRQATLPKPTVNETIATACESSNPMSKTTQIPD